MVRLHCQGAWSIVVVVRQGAWCVFVIREHGSLSSSFVRERGALSSSGSMERCHCWGASLLVGSVLVKGGA